MCSNTDLIFPALIQQTTKGTKLHKGKPSRLPVLRVPSCPWWFRNSLEANSMASFVCHKLFVIGGRQQRIQLARIFQFDFHNPRAMSAFVDLLRSRSQFVIYLRDRAGCGSIKIGNRFHGFHRPESFARAELGTDLGHLDKDNIHERFLRVISDAYSCAVAIRFDPLVLFRVFEICRICHPVFLRVLRVLCGSDSPLCPLWFTLSSAVYKTALPRLLLSRPARESPR